MTTEWFRAVNDLVPHTRWLHPAAIAFAEYGVVLFAALLLVSWLLARRRADLGAVGVALSAPFACLLALAVNQPIVNAVREARPYSALPHVHVLVARSSDFSFPSDHAVLAGAVAAGILMVDRRLGLVALLLAVLMCIDRVYVGAHYPHDVAAGAVLGAVLALASLTLTRPVSRWGVERLALSPLRPLVVRSSR